MQTVLYKGRKIEPKVFGLRDGGYSIAATVYTDEGGSVKVQEYYTENTASTEEEAIRRAYSLGQRAIDEFE